MAIRLDYGTTGNAQETPQGGMRVPAYLTRAGVFRYITADGQERHEWRPLSEVSKPSSLATLDDATVTMRHPVAQGGEVNASNWRTIAVGHVARGIKMDGDKVAADVIVSDGDTINRVKRGVRETSCGYRCDVIPGEGIVPEGEPDAGKRYDATQRNITYNHVAILEAGRAGRDVRLRLDGAGDSIADDDRPQREKRMDKIEIIAGVEYTVGTPAHAHASKERDARRQKRKDEAEALTKRTTEAEAKAKDATDKLTLATKRADEAEAKLKPEALSKMVRERASLVSVGEKVLGKDFKADASDVEIRKAILGKIEPDLKLDGKSDDQIGLQYEMAELRVKREMKRGDGEGGKRTVVEVKNDGDLVADLDAYDAELKAHGRVNSMATRVSRGDHDVDRDPLSKELDEFERKQRQDTIPEAPRHSRPLAMSKDAK